MPRFERPRASTIGTPVYHRRRRDWKDDRDLIEEIATSVNKLNGPYEYYDKGVFAFREKVKAIRISGYENNNEVIAFPNSDNPSLLEYVALTFDTTYASHHIIV